MLIPLNCFNIISLLLNIKSIGADGSEISNSFSSLQQYFQTKLMDSIYSIYRFSWKKNFSAVFPIVHLVFFDYFIELIVLREHSMKIVRRKSLSFPWSSRHAKYRAGVKSYNSSSKSSIFGQDSSKRWTGILHLIVAEEKWWHSVKLNQIFPVNVSIIQ